MYFEIRNAHPCSFSPVVHFITFSLEQQLTNIRVLHRVQTQGNMPIKTTKRAGALLSVLNMGLKKDLLTINMVNVVL